MVRWLQASVGLALGVMPAAGSAAVQTSGDALLYWVSISVSSTLSTGLLHR